MTFRQTDPLYVIDLTDPANPVLDGELKIPGYSAYLHPVGDGLLLGVGQDATETGQTLGTQLSLFDVSDPTNPQQIDTLPDRRIERGRVGPQGVPLLAGGRHDRAAGVAGLEQLRHRTSCAWPTRSRTPPAA